MAKQIDVEPTKTAITTLANVPSVAQQAREKATATPTGPFGVYVNAGYDRSFFVNRKTCEYEFEVDFPDSRLRLNKFLIGAGQNLDTFLGGFQSVDEMLKKTVPEVRAQFEAARAELLTAISVAAGLQTAGFGISMNFSEQVTMLAQLGSAQLGSFIEQLEKLAGNLQSGLGLVGSGASALTHFSENRNGYAAAILQSKQAFQSNVDESLKAVQSAIEKQPAGQAQAQEHFEFLKSVFASSLDDLETIFTAEVKKDLDNTKDSLDVVEGTVKNIISRNEALIDELKSGNGKRSAASIEAEVLDIGSATTDWQNIAVHTAKVLTEK